jgi:hypothetical protein
MEEKETDFQKNMIPVLRGSCETRNPQDIYEYFFNDDTCEHIAGQTNLYAEQKIHEKIC